MRTSGLPPTVLLVFALAGGACRTASPPAPIVQPGRRASRAAPSPQPRPLRLSFTPADVEFMQGMIRHHAQAIEMVDLLTTRHSDDMRKLGQRIELSQADEIKMMREWLEARGQEGPPSKARAAWRACPSHAMGAMLMPGMLTGEEMDRLAAAKGPTFDRLFLECMIQHHAGALTMVEGSVRDAWRRRRTRTCSRSPRMSTRISGWRSRG